MGAALYISLENKIDGIDATAVGGKFLAKHQKQLDALCKGSDCKPISSFISASADDVPDFVPQFVAKMMPKEAWFDPAEGLKTAEYLLSKIAENPADFPSPLQADIASARDVLSEATKQHVRFHFSVDY